MSMTVSRLGQANQTGDVDDLFLKQYAGEILVAFRQVNVTMGRHQVRTISQGKSASFPVTGRATASYHTVGTRIDGGQIGHGEKVITIDDLLISPTFIANIDEAKNHYDVRSVYSQEQGYVLSEQMDKHVLQTNILSARSAATLSGLDGGSVIYTDTTGMPSGSDFTSDPASIAAGLFKAAEFLDNKKVPETDRVCYLRPAQYYLLAQSEKAINRDFGGAGAYSDGTVFRVAGIEIVKTVNLPNSNVAAGTVEAGTGDKYAGDFSNTAGLITHKSAAGTVKLLDLAMDVGYDMDYQGHKIIAKYAVGHGTLRPEGAVELRNEVEPA